MRRKEQYADEIIKMLERTKSGAWASNINLNTKDRVIEVCQNCVDSWSGREFKDHCTTPPQALEHPRWISVSERLPEDGTYLICTDYGYIATIMYDRSMGWLLDSNIIAWMPLPEPYSKDKEETLREKLEGEEMGLG